MTNFIKDMAGLIREDIKKMNELINCLKAYTSLKNTAMRTARSQINCCQNFGLNQQLRIALVAYNNENAFPEMVIATLKIMLLESAKNLPMARVHSGPMIEEEHQLKQIEIEIAKLS
jgi:hypothetical protein